MRIQIVTLTLAGAVSLSAAVMAQDITPTPPILPPPDLSGADANAPLAPPTLPAPVLTAEQSAMQAEWADEQRLAYEGWSGGQQAYFWSLPMARRTLYWNLAAGAREELEVMTPVQREDAWSGLEARLAEIDSAEPMAETPEVVDEAAPESGPNPEAPPGVMKPSGDEIMDDNHSSNPEPL